MATPKTYRTRYADAARAKLKGCELAVVLAYAQFITEPDRPVFAPWQLIASTTPYSRRAIAYAVRSVRAKGWLALYQARSRHSSPEYLAVIPPGAEVDYSDGLVRGAKTAPLDSGLEVQLSASRGAMGCTSSVNHLREELTHAAPTPGGAPARAELQAVSEGYTEDQKRAGGWLGSALNARLGLQPAAKGFRWMLYRDLFAKLAADGWSTDRLVKELDNRLDWTRVGNPGAIVTVLRDLAADAPAWHQPPLPPTLVEKIEDDYAAEVEAERDKLTDEERARADVWLAERKARKALGGR
jgi:hypothetical protein